MHTCGWLPSSVQLAPRRSTTFGWRSESIIAASSWKARSSRACRARWRRTRFTAPGVPRHVARETSPKEPRPSSSCTASSDGSIRAARSASSCARSGAAAAFLDDGAAAGDGEQAGGEEEEEASDYKHDQHVVVHDGRNCALGRNFADRGPAPSANRRTTKSRSSSRRLRCGAALRETSCTRAAGRRVMSRGAIFAYRGCGALVAAALIDEYSGLRKWRTARRNCDSRRRRRPAIAGSGPAAPLGVQRPAGRVLECALADVHSDSVVLELGAGIGMTSIGLALATTRVVATDVDDDALDNLRANAERHKATLTVARWDATGAARQSPAHCRGTHTRPRQRPLLLWRRRARVWQRRSPSCRGPAGPRRPPAPRRPILGGAVAAVAAVAGVEHSTTTDVAMSPRARVREHGLGRHPSPTTPRTASRGSSTRGRASSGASGAWEGFVLPR